MAQAGALWVSGPIGLDFGGFYSASILFVVFAFSYTQEETPVIDPLGLIDQRLDF